jgi:hypothetical protein
MKKMIHGTVHFQIIKIVIYYQNILIILINQCYYFIFQ